MTFSSHACRLYCDFVAAPASIFFTTFSIITTPTSTITPMAMAMPDRATMLASTPATFITMNVAITAKGSMAEMTADALRLSTRTSTTMMQMSTSWVRASSSVPMVSRMSCVRS